MTDINKQIEDLLKDKVKNCKNSTTIFDTKDYVLFGDAIDAATMVLSQYVSNTTFADAFRSISGHYRWRKVNEELPNNGQIILVKTIDSTYHTAGYYANRGDFYSVSMYELNDYELFLIDGIVEWKPID